ncbi:MAG: hypothetical protein CL843_12015 [Crocinitomicaceae bacterium]|nr:hypothetical protein [Crocinitomicaceae bacterium]|tara:strand:+ start:1299 stop:1520 length:222 start_codon:yes stop_codon:yes gene_type:complete
MIHVYKTNVPNHHVVEWLKPELNAILSPQNWNFDLEDCDKIFRIDSNCQKQVYASIQLIKNRGYFCTELEDES